MKNSLIFVLLFVNMAFASNTIPSVVDSQPLVWLIDQGPFTGVPFESTYSSSYLALSYRLSNSTSGYFSVDPLNTNGDFSGKPSFIVYPYTVGKMCIYGSFASGGASVYSNGELIYTSVYFGAPGIDPSKFLTYGMTWKYPAVFDVSVSDGVIHGKAVLGVYLSVGQYDKRYAGTITLQFGRKTPVTVDNSEEEEDPTSQPTSQPTDNDWNSLNPNSWIQKFKPDGEQDKCFLFPLLFPEDLDFTGFNGRSTSIFSSTTSVQFFISENSHYIEKLGPDFAEKFRMFRLAVKSICSIFIAWAFIKSILRDLGRF